MSAAVPLIHSTIPYVLISGSYQRNRTNDKLCTYLGNKLAQQNIGIISGGNKPGLKVSESMNKILTDLNQYEHDKIVTVFRRKGNKDELRIKRIGSIYFVGNDIQELREFLIYKSKAIIVIDGITKTREEVLLAQERNLPVIPVGMSGGTAYNVWIQYSKSEKYQNEASFVKLNNQNPFIAADAVVSILNDLTLNDAKKMHTKKALLSE